MLSSTALFFSKFKFFYRPLSSVLKAKSSLVRRVALSSGDTIPQAYSFFSWRWPLLTRSSLTFLSFQPISAIKITDELASTKLTSSGRVLSHPMPLRSKYSLFRAKAVFFSFSRYWQIYKFASGGLSSVTFLLDGSNDSLGFSSWRFKLFNPRSLQQKYKLVPPTFYFFYRALASSRFFFALNFFIWQILSLVFIYLVFFCCVNFLFFVFTLSCTAPFDLSIPFAFNLFEFSGSLFDKRSYFDGVYFIFDVIIGESFFKLLLLAKSMLFFELLNPLLGFSFNVPSFLMLSQSFNIYTSHISPLFYFLPAQYEMFLTYFYSSRGFFFNFDPRVAFTLQLFDCVHRNILSLGAYPLNFTDFLNILPRYTLLFELALPPLMLFNGGHLAIQLFEKTFDMLSTAGIFVIFFFLILVTLIFCVMLILTLTSFVRYAFYRYDTWNVIFLWVYSRDTDFLLLNPQPLGVLLSKNIDINRKISSYLDPLSGSFDDELSTLYSREFEETFYGYSGFTTFAPSDGMLFNSDTFLQKFRGNMLLRGNLSAFSGFAKSTGYSFIRLSPHKSLKFATNFTASITRLYEDAKRYVFFENYGSGVITTEGQTLFTVLLEKAIKRFFFCGKFFPLNSKFKILNAKKFTLNFLKQKLEGLVFSPVGVTDVARGYTDYELFSSLAAPLSKRNSVISKFFKALSVYGSQNKISRFGLESSSNLSLYESELNHYQLSYDLDKLAVIGGGTKLFRFGFFEHLNEFSFWRRELNIDLHVEYPFWYQDFRAEQLTSVALSGSMGLGSAEQPLKVVGASGYQEEEDEVSGYLGEDSNLPDYSSTATLDWEGPITDYGLLSEEDEDDPDDFFAYRYRLVDFVRQEYNRHLWRQTWFGIRVPHSSKILNAQQFSSDLENREESESLYWRSFERNYSRNNDYTQDVNVTDYSGDYKPRDTDYHSYAEGLFSAFYQDLVSAYCTNCDSLSRNNFCTTPYHRMFTVISNGTPVTGEFTRRKTNFHLARKNPILHAYSKSSGARFLKFFRQNAFFDHTSESVGWRYLTLLFLFLFFLFALFFLFLIITFFTKTVATVLVIYNSDYNLNFCLSFFLLFIFLVVVLTLLFKQVLLEHLTFTNRIFVHFSFHFIFFSFITGLVVAKCFKLFSLMKKSNFIAKKGSPSRFVTTVPLKSHCVSATQSSVEDTTTLLIRLLDFVTNNSLPLFDNSIYTLRSAAVNPYSIFLKLNLLSEQVVESYVTFISNREEIFSPLRHKFLLLRVGTFFCSTYLQFNIFSSPSTWSSVTCYYKSKLSYLLFLTNLFDFYYYPSPFCKTSFIAYTTLIVRSPHAWGAYSWKFFSVKHLGKLFSYRESSKRDPVKSHYIGALFDSHESIIERNYTTDWGVQSFFMDSRIVTKVPQLFLLKTDSTGIVSKLFYGLLDHPIQLKSVIRGAHVEAVPPLNLIIDSVPRRTAHANSALYSNKVADYLRFNSYNANHYTCVDGSDIKIRPGSHDYIANNNLGFLPVSFARDYFLGRNPSLFETNNTPTPLTLPSLDSVHTEEVGLNETLFASLYATNTQLPLAGFIKYDSNKRSLTNERLRSNLTFSEQIFYNRFFLSQSPFFGFQK